ncbi:unnamed protein product [Vicia faba]|uniref:Uncharacterized protein n=1 Tax=Vicia faba TaxID=3906 RepID=A0AAV0YTI7_VICFA|nr:unnamed protein product [Vicia faba]
MGKLQQTTGQTAASCQNKTRAKPKGNEVSRGQKKSRALRRSVLHPLRVKPLSFTPSAVFFVTPSNCHAVFVVHVVVRRPIAFVHVVRRPRRSPSTSSKSSKELLRAIASIAQSKELSALCQKIIHLIPKRQLQSSKSC